MNLLEMLFCKFITFFNASFVSSSASWENANGIAIDAANVTGLLKLNALKAMGAITVPTVAAVFFNAVFVASFFSFLFWRSNSFKYSSPSKPSKNGSLIASYLPQAAEEDVWFIL